MDAAVARDRTSLLSGGVLILTALLAWAALLMQADMPVPGAGGGGEALAFLAAWGIMMAAMMLPSATPMIALYAALRRTAAPGGPGGTSRAARPHRRFTACLLGSRGHPNPG